MTTARPMSATSTPDASASWPSVGPTVWLWAYSKLTGSEPLSSTVCIALASSSEYPPVIWTLPSGISDWTAGADCTSLSRMMTILPFVGASSFVASANALAPSASSVMFTA